MGRGLGPEERQGDTARKPGTKATALGLGLKLRLGILTATSTTFRVRMVSDLQL